MRATNAKAIDFSAFGMRGIEGRRLAALTLCVKPVLRFHAISPPKTPKSPQDVQSHGLRRPAGPASSAASAWDQSAGWGGCWQAPVFDKGCISMQSERAMMASALTRVPSSPFRLAVASALILIVIAILPL
jgi:hypothetical protein